MIKLYRSKDDETAGTLMHTHVCGLRKYVTKYVINSTTTYISYPALGLSDIDVRRLLIFVYTSPRSGICKCEIGQTN